MITGYVDVDLRPKIELKVQESGDSYRTILAIVDTGFTGQLKMLRDQLAGLYNPHPQRTSTVSLADASEREIPIHTVVIDWDGENRAVEVLGMDGRTLIGMDLLLSSLTCIEGSLRGEVRNFSTNRLTEKYRCLRNNRTGTVETATTKIARVHQSAVMMLLSSSRTRSWEPDLKSIVNR